MTNEQTVALLLGIQKRIQLAQWETLLTLPKEESNPDEHSTASKVQKVFYDLEREIRNQIEALCGKVYY